jgi:hypothetical protein
VIERGQALRIVSALRAGSNCLDGVEHFSAGRGQLLKAASQGFDHLEESDGSVVRWVRGRTGQGKTHLFARLIAVAHRRNWVTSYVQISDRGQGVELHRFEEIYAAIIRNCLCDQIVHQDQGKVSPGNVHGWEWILEAWWLGLRSQAAAGGGSIQTFRLREAIDQTITGMMRKFSLNGTFSEALRQYAQSRADGDEEWSEIIRAWFKAENVHGRSALVRKRLRDAGIAEPISRRNAKEMLRSVSVFLKYRGFGGMLILIDELENVLHQTRTARRTAYTILRELIDNVDDRHGMKRTAFYVSATPDVFDSQEGITEYEALAERVLLLGTTARRNPLANIIDLAAWPLTRDELIDLTKKLAEVHGVALQWSVTVDALGPLVELLDKELARNPDMTARTWTRAVVDELDGMSADAEQDGTAEQ